MFSPFCTVPPSIHGLPSHVSPTEGEGVRIETKVKGHPPPTIVWYHGSEILCLITALKLMSKAVFFFQALSSSTLVCTRS